MATQHNVFIRRYGDKALVMTVTDWDDFKELESKSEHESPDFLIGATTNKDFDGTPIISLHINSELKDMTSECKGDSINGVALKPIWAINKFKSVTEMMG